MKGFIEITHFDDGYRSEDKLLRTSLIPVSSIKVIEIIRYYKSQDEAECVLEYNNTRIYPTQTYEEIKELIKNAQ